MGRKLKGAALRAHKRGKAAQDEIVDTIAGKVETQHVEEQPNDQLFVIDTTGDQKARVPPHLKQIESKKKNKAQLQSTSLDQQRVNALVERHDAQKLQAMAKAGAMRNSTGRNRKSVVTRSHKKSFDLWGTTTVDDEDKKLAAKKEDPTALLMQKSGIKGDHHVSKAPKAVSKAPHDAVAVDVAHGGQSYRPDPKHYQKVVQDAVSLEVRRNKAEQDRKEPLSKGMSPETRALLLGDSSDEDDDDDEKQKEEEVVIRKRADKKTRAERNRQKRIRQERAMEQKQKQTKKLLNSVAELPRYKKELKKHQQELVERKVKAEQGKKQKRGTPGQNYFAKLSEQDPIHAPTFPVALESEHKDSSLRTMKPKGSLVTDRMASFVDRNLVSKRKMGGDKKRIVQGKRRKLNVKGKGYEIAKEMDHKLMG